MKICDNAITRSIANKHGRRSILKAAQKYVSWMHNNPYGAVKPFRGIWKGELTRVLGPRVPKCKEFKTIGKNYDEMKYFCRPIDSSDRRRIKANKKLEKKGGDSESQSETCTVYSIGSNNQWDFERALRGTFPMCRTHAFDCTVGHKAAVPMNIKMTELHRVCLAASQPHQHKHKQKGEKEEYNQLDYFWTLKPENANIDLSFVTSGTPPKVLNFTTLRGLNTLAKAPQGADLFKIDIEGYEWNVLSGLVREAFDANLNADRHVNSSTGTDTPSISVSSATMDKPMNIELPKQIYAELHLDRDSRHGDNAYKIVPSEQAHVGPRLRYWLDEMFIKGGYMTMFTRLTAQSRNADILLVKVLCDL
jgi:hypothetical protein